MKLLNITILVTFFCLLSVFVNADDEAPAPKRSSILLRRPSAQRAGPLNKGAAAATSSTTTTVQPEHEETDEEDYDQSEDLEGAEKGDGEHAAPSTTTTTTEPPKKIGPIIRPFRSNDDLLSALKRRQQSSKKGVQHKIVEKPAPAKSENEDDEAAPAPVASPKISNDRAGRRNKFAAKKSSPSASASENVDVNEQPASPVVKRPVRYNLKTIKST